MLTSKLSLKILSNALSLIGAIVFLVIFLDPKDQNLFKFDDWGNQWSTAYYQKHTATFKELIKQLQKGETDSTVLQLQNDWNDLEKRDRVYRLKRKLLFALSEELHRQKRYNELLKWSSEWRKIDDRDVDAIAFFYEALYRSKHKQPEGFNGLKLEWHRFPDSLTLVGFYSLAVEERKIHDPTFETKKYDLRQAFIQKQWRKVVDSARKWKVRLYTGAPTTPMNDREYENYVDSHDNLKETWEVIHNYLKGETLDRYPAKHGLTPSQQAEYWIKEGAKTKTLFGKLHYAVSPQKPLVSKPLKPGLVTNTNNWSQLTLKLGPDTDALRIDLPPKIELQIDKVRIRMNTITHPVPLSQIKSKNMALVNNSLTTTSDRGRYFFVQMNGYLPHIRNEKDISIELVIHVPTRSGQIPLADFSLRIED